MVRTIKSKASRSLGKGERAVLLPGTTGAEPWELWIIGASPAQCVQTCADPRENHWRKNTTLALPISQVFCLPLWIQETDTKQFASILPLQLELRGLQSRHQETAVFDWSVVDRESDRTLIIVGILPASLPKEIQSESYHAFDFSARYIDFPENALTLWLERDRLVFAITRGKDLVYFQALVEGRVSSRVLQDLTCAVSNLRMQEVVTSFTQITVWTEITSADLNALQDTLHVPAQRADRPPPRIPSSAWKLVPNEVNQAKQNREAKRWQLRGLFVAGAVYLLFIAWTVSQFFRTSAQVDELHRWQANHAPALAAVHGTASSWNDLRAVVDDKSYPLELLLHVTSAIPTDQLHLTLFEAGDGHLLIKGEAKNVSAAFQFLDSLKKDPTFSGYTWVMGQPHLLPNDLAQLQIEGTRGTGDF